MSDGVGSGARDNVGRYFATLGIGSCGSVPKGLGKLLADQSDDFPLGWAGIIAKGKTSAEQKETKEHEHMHANHIGVPFHVAEGDADVDFLVGVGDAKVVDPYQEVGKRLREADVGFCFLGGEVVDCHGCQGRMVGRIENDSGFSVFMGRINQPEGSSMGIADVRKEGWVGCQKVWLK